MKELYLMKQETGYVCKDGDTIIYEGILRQSRGTSKLVMKNAFGDEIFAFQYTKSGFRLFRGSKPVNIDIQHQQQKGMLRPQQTCYIWELENCSYTFVCGVDHDQTNVIMRDLHDTLGYVKQGICYIDHLFYSAELCAVWMLMQELKDKAVLNMEAFQRAFEIVEQQ